jgi:hypothetical protein
MPAFKFAGYCDESEDDTSMAIACVFGRVDDWPLIEEPWQALLDEYGMDEFHAEHCEHRKGFWETWDDPTERRSVAQRFIDLIAKTALPFPTVYATAVDLKHFKEIAVPIIRAANPVGRTWSSCRRSTGAGWRHSTLPTRRRP